MSTGAPGIGFPLGAVVGAEAGIEVEITRRLRGDDARGQYDASNRSETRGFGTLVTVGPAQRRSRDELERSLALRFHRVAPLRGVFALTAPDGTRHDALVEGKPLGSPLADIAGPLGLATAVQLGVDLAETAAAAAREGAALIGIRPELTFLHGEGEARALSGVMPRAEVFLATAGEGGAPPLFPVRYAAPEVVLADPGGAAADVFSICATVAFAATGAHPFEGGDGEAQLAAMRAGRRRAWSGPEALGALLARGMAADPSARPSAGELAAELRRLNQPAASGGFGAKLLGIFGRRGGGSGGADRGDPLPPPPPTRPPDAGGDDFPIGAHLGGRDFSVTERIAGEKWRGRYRGVDRSGARVLITIAGEQTVKASQLRRELALEVPGIARLRYVGQVAGGPGPFDGMVEDEPPGAPIAALTELPSPRVGLSLGIGVAEIAAGAHAAGLVIGAFFPELIYLTAEAGRLAISGIAPRAEQFVRTASRPSFGLPDLFAWVYHAPEVLAGGARSAASDVFSLAALTTEWTTGRPAFDGDGSPARAVAIQMYARRPLEAPDGLRALLESGLERDPARRPSMAEWLSAARRLFETGGP